VMLIHTHKSQVINGTRTRLKFGGGIYTHPCSALLSLFSKLKLNLIPSQQYIALKSFDSFGVICPINDM